jgi:hypothetical protein
MPAYAFLDDERYALYKNDKTKKESGYVRRILNPEFV